MGIDLVLLEVWNLTRVNLIAIDQILKRFCFLWIGKWYVSKKGRIIIVQFMILIHGYFYKVVVVIYMFILIATHRKKIIQT